MIIGYHQYEILRNELNSDELSFLDEKNWILIDKSDKEKIIIQSGKSIADLLRNMKIEYNYLGLESYDRKEIPVINS